MKALYKEINTLRILPLDFMKNLGILLKWDEWNDEKITVVQSYYWWAMGHELSIGYGQEAYKAFCLLGDSMAIQDYNSRLEVWKKNNG